MGLDQYAFAVKGGEKVEIAYWRKHADLEGYMSELWRSRGNNGEFNCEELELDTEDLMNLQDSHRNLETANGFFWGESYPEDIEYTEKFIKRALEEISKGCKIIYYSWW